MQRKFLEELGLEKEVIDKIMAENGADIEKQKKATEKATQDLEKYKAENEGLKTQLSEANTQIQSFKEMDIDGIKASAEEWKTNMKQILKLLMKRLQLKIMTMLLKTL